MRIEGELTGSAQCSQGVHASQASLRRKASFYSNASRPQSERASDQSSYQSRSFEAPDDEWWERQATDHCGSRFTLHEANPLRSCWNAVISVLVIYIATIYLYRLCFIEFHIPEPLGQDDSSWQAFEEVVNVVFWIDLFASFLMTYRDSHGKEVDSLRLIARNYITGYFLINLIACTPDSVIESVMDAIGGKEESDESRHFTANRAMRISRIQRVSRLARLIRLSRLVKIASFKPTNHVWQWLQGLRGVRVINNTVCLLWIVHSLACGWYLCAALHDDPSETWVGRRSIDRAGELNLLDQGPLEQWCHAFYFVLTVFTTVGFGDMSAVTTGEIVYVCFIMMVGAIVHSIVISEVINVVTTADQTSAFVTKQMDLIEAFGRHTELDDTSQELMKDWVTFNARSWLSHQYNREEMKQLITGKYMPRWLLGQVPQNLFGGRLLRNQYFSMCGGVAGVPPRLPLLLALAVHRHQFEAGEIVYQRNDMPFNIYLVLDGTFANVARPTPKGGCDEECITGAIERLQSTHLYPYQLFSGNSYFGDIEVLESRPRGSTVRCESNGGAVLALHKRDFWQLVEEFPQFGASWRTCACRRSIQRLRFLGRLRCGMTYRHFAASRIQHFIRIRKRRRSTRRRTAISLNAKAFLLAVTNLDSGCESPAGGSAAPRALSFKEVRELRASVEALHAKFDALQSKPQLTAPTDDVPAGTHRMTVSVQDSAYGRQSILI
mmetsp:Transcript_85861/g.237841  ORF Transcript_85861/g.237841 Transcript_85861/m.237841 type:complete len:722 (+) Transcript_85861:68-2233(+)